MTIRRQAGVRRSVTSFFFFFSPSSSTEGAEVCAEPQRGGELHRKGRRGQEESRGKRETFVLS